MLCAYSNVRPEMNQTSCLQFCVCAIPSVLYCCKYEENRCTLYPIGRSVRATITLYPIGRVSNLKTKILLFAVSVDFHTD